ncbi:MAG: ATP-binding protein [Methanomassiliicoccaceae archaeon]|jgi:energy-coupling factor transporter ATP-binding protein EcfA2|nr:ATP-binding protein [Methanomassiliicoccaceae archaeon]
MLRKFSVSGYKNFNNETILDLTKVGKYEFNKECITDGLLGKVLLMGANASGKSNLGYAIFDIVYTLTDKPPCVWQVDAQSFINGDGNSKIAVFRYEFQMDGAVINYEYRKTAPHKLAYEKMSMDGNVIIEFDHTKNDLISGDLSLISSEKLRLGKVDGSLSVIRFIANNTPQKESSPISFIMDFVNRMLYYKTTQDGNMYIGLERVAENIEPYLIRNGLVGGFEKFLKENAGLDIKFEIVKYPGMPHSMVQKLKHKSIGFPVNASSGTKALELFYYWSRRFENVSFLFLDEFDAFYHFELAEKIVRFLMNYTKMQVILTSHNTSIVTNRVMRPDCYLQIKEGRISSFSESTDRELREGHNLEKMLRNGEFNE